MNEGHKYVWHKGMAEELFDLNADPAEVRNLSEDPAFAAIKGKMRQKMHTFLHETEDPLRGDWQDFYETLTSR